MKASASCALAPTVPAGAEGVAVGEPVGDPVGDSVGDGEVDSSSALNAGRFFAVGLGVVDVSAEGLGVVDASADGLEVVDASADGDGLAGRVTPAPGSAVAPALGSSGVAAVPQGPGAVLLQATVRKRSWAWRFTVSTSELSVSPGIST